MLNSSCWMPIEIFDLFKMCWTLKKLMKIRKKSRNVYPRKNCIAAAKRQQEIEKSTATRQLQSREKSNELRFFYKLCSYCQDEANQEVGKKQLIIIWHAINWVAAFWFKEHIQKVAQNEAFLLRHNLHKWNLFSSCHERSSKNHFEDKYEYFHK